MTETINPQNLKTVRTLRGLTQGELAKRAKLNKQTIYRLENEPMPVRQKTLDRISEALTVEVGVLTGEKAIPPITGKPGQAADNDKDQVKFRLDGATRNAFALAMRRYHVSPSRIVELAPFLFVVAAEMSLQRRLMKLDELQTALTNVGTLVSDFDHWLITDDNGKPIKPGHELLYEAIREEHFSIKSRNLFTEEDNFVPDWEPNPFFMMLKELASSCSDVAKIEGASSSFFDYQVCRDEALAIAGGDEAITKELLSGFILIREIPKDLMDESRTPERLEWLKARVAILEEKRSHFSLEMLELSLAEPDEIEVEP